MVTHALHLPRTAEVTDISIRPMQKSTRRRCILPQVTLHLDRSETRTTANALKNRPRVFT
jgi:hypothetical protein